MFNCHNKEKGEYTKPLKNKREINDRRKNNIKISIVVRMLKESARKILIFYLQWQPR